MMISFFKAWKTLWTEELGRLQSMGSLRVGHDSSTSLSLFTFTHRRQPTRLLRPYTLTICECTATWNPGACFQWKELKKQILLLITPSSQEKATCPKLSQGLNLSAGLEAGWGVRTPQQLCPHVPAQQPFSQLLLSCSPSSSVMSSWRLFLQPSCNSMSFWYQASTFYLTELIHKQLYFLQPAPTPNTHANVTSTGVQDEKEKEGSHHCDHEIINGETIQGGKISSTESLVTIKGHKLTVLSWPSII